MNRELLDKWLNGTISPSELDELKQDAAFQEYLKIDSFMKRLDLPDTSVSEGLDNLKKRISEPSKGKVIRLSPLLKIAAAAAVILLVGYIYLTSIPTDFETKLAETQLLELPDKSRVTLNENSELKFNHRNWDENRKVELRGEAYFEVAKGKKFEVVTEHGSVEVLGTKFNGSDRTGIFRVTWYEGLVRIIYNGQATEIRPGNAISLSGGKINSEKKYTTQPGWLHNESSFENVRLKWVLEELKTVYNVNIISENIDVDLRYTGSFTNTDLDSALQTITLPMRLEYAIENNNVILTPKE